MPLSGYAYIPTIADEINSGYWAWSGDQGTQPRYWENFHPGLPTNITVNVSELQSDEVGLVEWALQVWEDIANVTFTITTGAADITYNDYTKADGSATAVTTQTTFYDTLSNRLFLTGATVDISRNWSGGPTGLDSYFYQSLVHETGHALGLGHSGNYNTGFTNQYYNTNSTLFTNDTWQWSVMSYNDQSQYGAATVDTVLTPQMADIYAVQATYGAATSTRSGDTVYGFHSTAGALYDFSQYNPTSSIAPAFTIYDAGGNDTLDCSGYAENQLIDLRPGNWSSVGGANENIGIYTGVVIENGIGGSGDDRIIGNDAANALSGGGGDDVLIGLGGGDTLDGGGGTDTATYEVSPAAVNIFLTAQNLNSGGDAQGDTLISIENLIGSNYNDILSGDANNNVLTGGAGDDYLAGNGGTNVLDGGPGDDELASGAGADQMLGGTGIDTATYELSNGPVRADLLDSSTNTGEAAGDTYSSVENLIGSSFGDILLGDNNANVITYGLPGATGNDQLYGRGGNDTLNGGPGDDVLDGGTGNDTLWGQGGADTFQFDTALSAATNVDQIMDFTHGTDIIALSQTIFSALVAGVLPAADFVIGSAAQNSSEHIIYDSNAGALYYDPDGNGGAAETEFATLSTGLALTAADFKVIQSGPHAARHDFNGDSVSDILWRNPTTGADAIWDMNASGGHTAVNPGTVGTSVQVAGVGDFNGDGIADILWRNPTTGADAIWDMNASGGHTAVNPGTVGISVQVAGVGDFNGDGIADILWRNPTTGADAIWDMNAAGGHTAVNPGTVGTSVQVAGVGDFNGDGIADILWRNPTTGADAIWDMNAAGGHTAVNPGTVGTSVQVAGVGDFNGDGIADILWRNPTTGADAIWDMNAAGGHTAVNPGTVSTSVQVASVADFNGDGIADILWRNPTTGADSIWDMNAAGGHLAINPGTVSTSVHVVA